jgi:hypothetical protein
MQGLPVLDGNGRARPPLSHKVLIFYHEITENGIINYLLKFD